MDGGPTGIVRGHVRERTEPILGGKHGWVGGKIFPGKETVASLKTKYLLKRIEIGRKRASEQAMVMAGEGTETGGLH